jgi:hypothetical protein
MRCRPALGRRPFQNFFLLFAASLLILAVLQIAFGADKWAGVDEKVVKKFAEEQGRKAWEPFINTDQGDLLLFVFLAAGAIGGFVAGYYWRILIVEKSSGNKKVNH